jgi:hypothetical protein
VYIGPRLALMSLGGGLKGAVPGPVPLRAVRQEQWPEHAGPIKNSASMFHTDVFAV